MSQLNRASCDIAYVMIWYRQAWKSALAQHYVSCTCTAVIVLVLSYCHQASSSACMQLNSVCEPPVPTDCIPLKNCIAYVSWHQLQIYINQRGTQTSRTLYYHKLMDKPDYQLTLPLHTWSQTDSGMWLSHSLVSLPMIMIGLSCPVIMILYINQKVNGIKTWFLCSLLEGKLKGKSHSLTWSWLLRGHNTFMYSDGVETGKIMA